MNSQPLQRLSIIGAYLFFLCFSVPLHAELTTTQKQALFLQSVSKPSPSPSASPHHKKTSLHSSHTSHHSKKNSPHPHKHTTSTPISKKIDTPHSTTSSVLHTAASSTPAPSFNTSHDQIIPIDPSAQKITAPITIEKSGIIPDQGLEPTPPPATSHSWWPFTHDTTTYHYLSASTRRAIDRAPVRRGRWKYIIVHNSGTREGNARSFDIYHRRVRKMVNGLAYHFVIGNGVSSGNGEIEIGHRWTAQLNGGHVASDYLNDISLGICLVGDYNRDLPTKAQLGALTELITYLRHRVGKAQGHQSIVVAHKEINPRPTDCPGNRFPYTWLHGEFKK